MRILFWSSSFLPQIGGVGVLAAHFLPMMQRRGYQFLVISSRGDPNLPAYSTSQGIPVHRFTFWQSLAHINGIMEVKQHVEKLKRLFAPDLIHINGVGRDEFFHVITAGAHRCPSLVTLHGEWPPQADTIVRRNLDGANWIAGCSNIVLEKARNLDPEITPRSSLIYNALPELSIICEPAPIKAQRVLCLGRLSEEKGFDLAITAFASVVEQFPRARLVIAGDGPERSQLVKLATELRLSNAVEFLGWVAPDNVPALINTASMILIPSRQESFPVVALQAAQMARPVVATRVGGIPEAVAHQQTGLLTDAANSQALAQAVAFLFNNPQAAVTMGANARDRMQRDFTWEHYVNAYDTLYRQLLKQQPALATG